MDHKELVGDDGTLKEIVNKETSTCKLTEPRGLHQACINGALNDATDVKYIAASGIVASGRAFVNKVPVVTAVIEALGGDLAIGCGAAVIDAVVQNCKETYGDNLKNNANNINQVSKDNASQATNAPSNHVESSGSAPANNTQVQASSSTTPTSNTSEPNQALLPTAAPDLNAMHDNSAEIRESMHDNSAEIRESMHDEIKKEWENKLDTKMEEIQTEIHDDLSEPLPVPNYSGPGSSDNYSFLKTPIDSCMTNSASDTTSIVPEMKYDPIPTPTLHDVTGPHPSPSVASQVLSSNNPLQHLEESTLAGDH